MAVCPRSARTLACGNANILAWCRARAVTRTRADIVSLLLRLLTPPWRSIGVFAQVHGRGVRREGRPRGNRGAPAFDKSLQSPSVSRSCALRQQANELAQVHSVSPRPAPPTTSGFCRLLHLPKLHLTPRPAPDRSRIRSVRSSVRAQESPRACAHESPLCPSQASTRWPLSPYAPNQISKHSEKQPASSSKSDAQQLLILLALRPPTRAAGDLSKPRARRADARLAESHGDAALPRQSAACITPRLAAAPRCGHG
eukprot:2328595-Pleurochrysis_carterae.AAC.1